jgi:hypothetical protein
VKGVAGAFVRAADALIHGQPVFSDGTEIARRDAICQPCEYYVREDGRCELCGCAMARKHRLAREHCPIGKW